MGFVLKWKCSAKMKDTRPLQTTKVSILSRLNPGGSQRNTGIFVLSILKLCPDFIDRNFKGIRQIGNGFLTRQIGSEMKHFFSLFN